MTSYYFCSYKQKLTGNSQLYGLTGNIMGKSMVMITELPYYYQTVRNLS